MKLAGSLMVASAALLCTTQGAILRGLRPDEPATGPTGLTGAADGMSATITGASGPSASRPAVGVPNVVLKSMEYVMKASDSSIKRTDEDLATKIQRFEGHVAEEKIVVDKSNVVVQRAKDCQARAAKKIKQAKAEIASLEAQKIPESRISTAVHGIEAAETALNKVQREFNNDEALFKHDMTHLDAVKNESTRVITMMNNHFIQKQKKEAGGGMMEPKRTIDEVDKFDDLLPGKGHVIVGAQQSHNIAFLLETAAKHGLDTEDNLYASIAGAMRRAAKPSPEDLKKATTRIPVQKPHHANPKFHSRVPSAIPEVDSNTTETKVHRVDGEPESPKEGEAPGKMRVEAMGNSVKVGKDVGGHIISAVTKLHGFVNEHAVARKEAFELATKPVRKEIKHDTQEKIRITALLKEYKDTNKRLIDDIMSFKRNIEKNEKDIEVCKNDERRAILGTEDARRKMKQLDADVKALKAAYGTVKDALKKEKSQAGYIVSLLTKKLDALAEYMKKAKAVVEAKDAIIKANFTDPDLPKYEGLPFALKCDPNSTPEQWCSSPEMMVRCGVTKESCDTYKFKSTAIPETEVVPSTSSKDVSGTAWPKAVRANGANQVDARSIDQLKRDGELSVNALK
jgi:exonuclease VII small subunit